MTEMADIVIIGSGIGGASLAHSLAPSGLRIVILERGGYLKDSSEARDDVAIFQKGFYRSSEEWFGTDGESFLPGNYYYVGGNSKFFGAVMYRYRREDFAPRRHMDGASPGWPLSYEDLSPWYDAAEDVFKVRGAAGDPTEPPHAGPYGYPPVPDEPAIAAVRRRLEKAGIRPASLPLSIDIDNWLKRAKTGWDAFPNTGTGKIDAEVGPLASALAYPNVSLVTGAHVARLETDGTGRRVVAALYMKDGIEHRIFAGRFAVAAGAVQSAALLLRSADKAHPTGLGNGSDQLGRNFMNHNTTAMLTVDPFAANSCVYQKTIAFNDFYNEDNEYGFPLGNVQLLGHITGNILKANLPIPAPAWFARIVARYAYGWFLTSEDLPNPESRVMVRDGRIVMHWIRSNMRAHEALIAKTRAVMRKAGFPIVLTHTFGRKTTSHQCGTARMGSDPQSSVVDLDCRSHDVENLYITDASVLPTSAAVNPALTIAALAIKAGSAISRGR